MSAEIPTLKPDLPYVPIILLSDDWKALRRARLRRGWVWVALIFSLAAIGVEGVFGLCASYLFDPLPDVITGIAYFWVLFCLWFNEGVLAAGSPDAGKNGPVGSTHWCNGSARSGRPAWLLR